MRYIYMSLLTILFSTVLSAQDLTILHLNDTHSHVEPERSGNFAGKGGAIEQAAYIDSVRYAEGSGNVVLLHAGDFSQGTSYFKELGGDVEIDLINAMKFDAVCLGNHEFDNGIEELARRISRLEVPVVCANYDFSSTPLDTLVKPYVILQKNLKKIGVIGLLTDLSTVIDVNIASQLKYLHPAQIAEKYALMLKNELGCDLVVCLTHLGYEGEFYTDRQLAAQSSNIDIIIGGHSHTVLDDLKRTKDREGKEVVIVTDGKWGLRLGHLAIHFQKNRLTSLYDKIGGLSAFQGEYSDVLPYPAYSDRRAWERIMGPSARSIIEAGEKFLDYQWQSVPATAYLAYERTGERVVMQNPFFANSVALNTLILAELAEGQGRFIDQLINCAWQMSYMPTWVLSAHLPNQRSGRSLPDMAEQIIDLVSAEVGASMAILYRLFREEFDKVDPVISRTIKWAVKRHILDPYINADEHRAHWWMAYVMPPTQVVNNWNPWCNSNVMLCFLLLEDDPVRLDIALRQSAKSVDKFLAYIRDDGACEEGPAYWSHAGGKLYDYLKIMHDASGGKFNLFDDPQIKLMGEYISRSNIGGRWVVNFADASAQSSIEPTLVYNYGTAVGSPEMLDFALYRCARDKEGRFAVPSPVLSRDTYRSLESLECIARMKERIDSLNSQIDSGCQFDSVLSGLRENVPDLTWYPETQFCYMKNGTGWFFAGKGGHNKESHNHNDIGTFILYMDSIPIFVDAGVGTYTKKTFSEDRYTIWSMQSGWHNLPVINGVTQSYGPEYRASAADVKAGASGKIFSLDISGAYPQESGCQNWTREYRLKTDVLTITDSFRLDKRKAPDMENFLVQGQVFLPGQTFGDYKVRAGETIVVNEGKTVRLTFPVSLVPSVETKALDDPRFSNVWGDSLRRISFTGSVDAPVKGKYVFRISEF